MQMGMSPGMYMVSDIKCIYIYVHTYIYTFDLHDVCWAPLSRFLSPSHPSSVSISNDTHIHTSVLLGITKTPVMRNVPCSNRNAVHWGIGLEPRLRHHQWKSPSWALDLSQGPRPYMLPVRTPP